MLKIRIRASIHAKTEVDFLILYSHLLKNHTWNNFTYLILTRDVILPIKRLQYLLRSPHAIYGPFEGPFTDHEIIRVTRILFVALKSDLI